MRAFATLLWEQWRQTWRGLLLISAALLGYWLLLVFVERLVFIIFSNNPRIALAAAYVPVAGALGLLFMQESRSEIGFAYPKRMFWLPVHTYTLVGAQFIYKLVVIAALAAAAGWICATEIKLTFAIMPQILMFLGLTATLLGMVFLVSGFGSGTGLALFLPAAAISLIGFQPVLAGVSQNFLLVMPPSAGELARMGLTPVTGEFLYVYPEFPVWTWWGGAATVVWFAIVGYLAARHARSEVPGDRVGRWVRMVTSVTYLDRDNDVFASPEAAHRWFEWRRVVYLYPWITLAVGLVLVATLRSSLDEEENKFIVGFSLFAIAPAIIAVLIGYALTRPDPRYMWFVGGRPLTTSTISRVRLIVSIKAIAIAYLLAFIAYCAATFTLYGNANPIGALITDLELITSTYGSSRNSFVMLFSAVWLALIVVWSLFWLGRTAGVIAWIAAMIASAFFYLDGGRMYETQGENIVSPTWIVFGGTLTVLMAVGVVACYGLAIYRRNLSARILPVIAVVAAISAWTIFQFSDVVGQENMLAALIWLLVPLAPFATVPATLAWQRHR